MRSPLRVVHVHRDGRVSGSERHLLVLLPGLRERGLDVHFVSLRAQPEPAALERAVSATGVPTHHVPARKHLDPRTGASLRSTFARLAPDVVHTHLVHADVWGGLASASLGLRYVSSVHAAHNRHLNPVTESALRLAWLRASAVIAISDHVARFLAERRLCRADKIDVIKYGLPPAPQPAAPVGRWRTPPGPRALVASRLIPHKGHLVLLQAWVQVVRAAPEARLLVAGDGPLREQIEEAAHRMGVAGSVDFLGYQDDMTRLYSRADVVVFPTEEGFGEGFGLVNLEAMQAGLPVIASAKDSMPEIVVDGVTGRLVPPGDAAALARALEELLQQPLLAQRMGEAGAERAATEFNATGMVARTLSVYERVVADAGA